jgi:hypothetical protein
MTAPPAPSRRALAAQVVAVVARDLGRTDRDLAAMLGVTTAELSPVIGMLYRRHQVDRCGPYLVAPAPHGNGTSGTCGTRPGQAHDSGFRRPGEVPEPAEPLELLPARRYTAPPEDAMEEAALDRRVFVVGATGPKGSGQALGRGGGSETGAAQLVDHATAVPVHQRVRVPGQTDLLAVTHQPVVVHQRNAGLLRHATDGSLPTAQRELLDAALRCAAREWRSFPIRPRVKKPPAFPDHDAAHCPGTDPRCRSGHTGWEPRATTDPARISRAWAHAPYNIGIATGPSGLVVIDLDKPKPGDVPPTEWALPGITDGADVLAALCERHSQPFPWETFLVRTGRDGLHLYFTTPPGVLLRNTSGRSERGLGWLIDTRGHGGYVVAPGSVVDLPGGGTGRYEVINDRPPAPLPSWLATLLTAPAASTPPLGCRSAAAGQVSDLHRYAATALQGEAERVRAAVEPGRNHVLNKAAFHLGQLIPAGILPEDLTSAELYDAASVHFGIGTPPFTPAEARATIKSGIAAGKRKPRPLPTLGAAA